MRLVKGLFVNKRRDSAPSFIIGGLSIKKAEFIQWLNEQPEEDIRLDLLTSKKDNSKAYAAVNEWKPKPKEGQEEKAGDLPF